MGSKGKSRFKAPRAGGSGGSPMMRQLEELQKQMMEAQTSLADQTVTAASGGGAVTIEMTGAQEMRAITIKPEVLDPDDVEMLQDLIMAAYGEALEKSRKLAEDRLGPLTGGVDIPGLF
ncbi:MAG: YbaB/EbfC family nucleoid-associated protein [Anaerolineae bacterium]